MNVMFYGFCYQRCSHRQDSQHCTWLHSMDMVKFWRWCGLTSHYASPAKSSVLLLSMLRLTLDKLVYTFLLARQTSRTCSVLSVDANWEAYLWTFRETAGNSYMCLKVESKLEYILLHCCVGIGNSGIKRLTYKTLENQHSWIFKIVVVAICSMPHTAHPCQMIYHFCAH